MGKIGPKNALLYLGSAEMKAPGVRRSYAVGWVAFQIRLGRTGPFGKKCVRLGLVSVLYKTLIAGEKRESS